MSNELQAICANQSILLVIGERRQVHALLLTLIYTLQVK